MLPHGPPFPEDRSKFFNKGLFLENTFCFTENNKSLDQGLKSYVILMHLSMSRLWGGGRAWGKDLIVFVGPRVGHSTDLVLSKEGIFESFFTRRGDI